MAAGAVVVALWLGGCAVVAAPSGGEPGSAGGGRAPDAAPGSAPATPPVADAESVTEVPPDEAGAAPEGPGTPVAAPSGPREVPQRGTALAAVAALTVKGRAPMTGYDRDRFGPAWLDADRNGCDTRNDVLGRDLTSKKIRPGTGGCVVERGRLDDPYTASAVTHVRGHGALVDIDHVVALGNSWSSGAWRWQIATRAALANDPLNLLAVDSGANRAKGDGDAATWLPPSRTFRCSYVARQVAVKRKYALSVTPAEKQAMLRVLSTCPAQRLPADSGAPVEVDHRLTDPGAPQPEPAPRPRPEPARPGTGGGSVSFENCDAARSAGAAPVRAGDPGYGRHLDRDGDGSACE